MNKLFKRKVISLVIGIFSIIAGFFSLGLTNFLIATSLNCSKYYYQGLVDYHSCPLIRDNWIIVGWLGYFIIWFIGITFLINKIHVKR